MYPVSEAYKKAIQDNTRSYYYKGEIVTKNGLRIPFENKDILKGSGYITNQCCGSSEIEIGSVYAAEMGITLFSTINRYTLEGASITLSFFLQLDSGKYEEVPMGIFEISEANRTAKCIVIKAYDYMLRFDKDFNNIVTSGTAYELLKLGCQLCKVELAHTEEELKKWNNSNIALGIYADNDIETWRDVIYYVAQVLGAFATINRQGKLELRKYGNSPVMDIPWTQRFNSTFSDFVTRYTAVNSTNEKTQTAEYYAIKPDDGLTMNLGINPLLQFGLKETREEIINNILNDISKINYVPFDSSTIGNPAFDLGDVITFSGGHADEKQITCITKYEYKVNGKHALQCVGKNPRLSQAKSKNDKNISGLLNSIEAGKIIVHTFMNASPFRLGEANTEVASIEFASNENTDAQFHGSILLEVDADDVEKTGKIGEQEFVLTDDGQAAVTVTYVLNDSVLSTYVPIETWHSGRHILNLYYPLNGLEANAYNTFKVRIQMTGGTGQIGRGQAVCTISGQGLSSNNIWDGRLEIKEVFEPFNFEDSLKVREMFDKPVPYTEYPTTIIPTDRIARMPIGGFGVRIFGDAVKINPVIVTEIIEVADRDEMTYNRVLIQTDTVFEFKHEYVYRSKEKEIDRGRMTVVTAETEQFATIESLEVSQDDRL